MTTARVVARARDLARPEALEAEASQPASSARSRRPRSRGRRRGRCLPSRRVIRRSAWAAAAGIVGDHDHRLAELVDRLAQQPQHVLARLRVEVAGRLVGEDDGRFGDQGAGDGDALLLAAGELGGPVGAAVARGRRCRISWSTQAWSGLRPAIESGSTRFSSAVRTGSRLKNWKTKPSLSRRSLVSSPSSRPVISSPSSRTVPAVGVSSPARMCIRVDLPEPDGPMIAVKRPRSKPVLTSTSASTAASPSP